MTIRIYHKDEKGNKVSYCVIGGSPSDAISEIERLRSEHKGVEYMWEFDKEPFAHESGKRTILRRFFGFICRTAYRIWDSRHNAKWGFQRMFKGYDDRVSWDLDTSLIDMFLKNLPKLIEYKHGCSEDYIIRAFHMMNPGRETEVEDEYRKTFYAPREVMNIAMALQKNDLEKLLFDFRVLNLCINDGFQDDINDPDYLTQGEFEIPKYKYSNEIDYDKLDEIKRKTQDEIFDFLKKNLGTLWD